MTAAFRRPYLELNRWHPMVAPPLGPQRIDVLSVPRLSGGGSLTVTVVATLSVPVAIDAHFGDTHNPAPLAGRGTLTAEVAGYVLPHAEAHLRGGGKLTTTLLPIQHRIALNVGTGTLSVEFETRERHAMAYLSDGVGRLRATAVNAFKPMPPLENVDAIDRPVPVGTAGCWVTLIGAGGSGGNGDGGSFSVRGGGGGGGGAATIQRSFVPRAQLGTTYSVTRGRATPAANGAASTFTSHYVRLTAGGGGLGGNGAGGGGSEGRSGSATFEGVVGILTRHGSPGGHGSSGQAEADDAPDVSGGGCPGGGGGGGRDGLARKHQGGDGGNSVAAVGGAAPPTLSGSPGGIAGGHGGSGHPGGGGGGASMSNKDDNGYNGGAGGNHGAGGGGGSGGNVAGTGGMGGIGYTLIEWV